MSPLHPSPPPAPSGSWPPGPATAPFRPLSAGPHAPPPGRKRNRDMDDFDPIRSPTYTELLRDIRADTSEYSIAGLDEDLVADVFHTFADSAATRTIGADRSAWKKWKGFLARNKIRKLWRNDHAANSGKDPFGHRREVLLLRSFMIDTHRNMKPRRRTAKRARPKSALNTLAGVRRIHKRAGIDMVDGAALGMALKGLNNQYIAAEGHNGALLEERKEPLTNADAEKMLGVDDGTPMPGWTVAWRSAAGISFRAGLCSGRHGGFRKADLASLGEFVPHDMSRNNLTWYINLNGDGNYVHVSDLPAGYRLRDGDCAVIRPGVSKADQSAATFGNHPVYLPFVSRDPCNAALALADLVFTFPCAHADRKTTPLLVCDEGGSPLTCDQIDRMFAALAVHALGKKRADELSFHSCRIFAACAHKANDEPDELVQALVRWKTTESLKIYARINPMDYAARVRAMVATDVDSRIASRLPQLDDDQLHKQIKAVLTKLTNGADISDVLPDDNEMSDAEDDNVLADAAATCAAAAGARREHSASPRGEGGGVTNAAPCNVSTTSRPTKRRSVKSKPNAASARAASAAGRTLSSQRAAAPAASAAVAAPAAASRGSSAAGSATPRKRMPSSQPITIRRDNPKQANSKSFNRYERYKLARTRGEFASLGGLAADFAHDLAKGYIITT